MKTAMEERARNGAIKAAMKAVRMHKFGGPEVLKYEEISVPRPGQGEVLLRVHAAGVNPVDWKIREGYRKGATPLPLVPGWDVSGVVEATGPGAPVEGRRRSLRPRRHYQGRLVRGVHGRPRVGPRAETRLRRPCPCGGHPLSGAHGVAVAFRRGGPLRGTDGAHPRRRGRGRAFRCPVGRWKGATRNRHGYGADSGVCARDGRARGDRFQGPPGLRTSFMTSDVVLDIIGGDTQKRSWQVLKKGGILVSTVGITSPEGRRRTRREGEAMVAHSDADDLEEMAELVDSGNVNPVVHVILPLNEAAKAHELLQQGGIRGKIVLKVV